MRFLPLLIFLLSPRSYAIYSGDQTSISIAPLRAYGTITAKIQKVELVAASHCAYHIEVQKVHSWFGEPAPKSREILVIVQTPEAGVLECVTSQDHLLFTLSSSEQSVFQIERILGLRQTPELENR